MSPPHLTVVGHCTIDDIHYVDGRELPGTFGGAAAYASLGAALAGASVRLVTLVGDDYPLERLETALSGAGPVDMSDVRCVPGRSIHNDAWYALDGGRRFDVEDWSRLEELTPLAPDLPIDLPAGGIVQLTPASVWQQEVLVDALRRLPVRIALDTELHYLDESAHRARLLALVRRVDIFLPSIEHLQLLFGSRSRNAGDYIASLAQLGCPVVVVKQGREGSTVLDVPAGVAWRVPALDGLALADPTGAGDGYGGGFLTAYSAGRDLAEAACQGTVCASFVVESVGAAVPAHFSEELAEQRLVQARSRVEKISLSAVTAAQGAPTR